MHALSEMIAIYCVECVSSYMYCGYIRYYRQKYNYCYQNIGKKAESL